ncbi:MAG: replicative DNA helicase [Patescibacteria group bacterium]|nr:replicative DNA helicase [Patescibacteria group bacterium]MDE1965697.1 replicative DNA helicase [Patescibacteria group bacterium]
MAAADRIPPQSLESERALLGALLLRPDALHDVIDTVREDSFYAEKHRLIFEAMRELSERGEPVDLLALSERLANKGQLERAGGRAYLTELADAALSPGNLSYYADLVAQKHLRRALIETSYQIAETAHDESRDTHEVLDEAEKSVYAIGNAVASHKFIALSDKLAEAWDRIESLSKKGDGIRGVPTGYPELDNLLSGFHPSDLIILAARPSMGKTSLALDIARNAAVRHGISVGIFSLEMSSEQLVDRMLAAESYVNAWKIRTGAVHAEEEFAKIRDALESLSKAPIYIDDKPGNNILSMRAVARRLKRERGIGLIVVDYLQLMTPTSTKASDSMVQQVTEISRSLKSLARELEVPVLALSQLSRAVEQRGGRPRLSDLRDSGCLTGDTLVMRADTGERVAIKDLVGKENVPLVSMDAGYELRPMLASRIFPSGRKRVFELTLRSGRAIKASGNHRFLTLSGWQRLDALTVGDRLASPRLLTAYDAPARLSTHELILLAHLLGDGCVLPRQPVHYTSADTKNLDAVEDAARELFGITPRRVKQGNWWHSYLPAPFRLTRGKPHPITAWYRALGIAPVRSYEKRIPQAVFASDSKSIQLFLHHLWATDGNISWKRLPGRMPSAAIYYATTSRGLAEDVQHLLLRLGIWSTVRTSVKKGYRPSYQVHVQSTPVEERFLSLVGSYGARGAIVKELSRALAKIAPLPNTDTIPQEVWGLVDAAKDAHGMSWRGLAQELHTAYNGSALTATGVSRARLAKVARALRSERLLHLAESDVYWDEISSITLLGTEEVYDATVPGTHNFVAGDIIVHNSIEQDADVVMFIHREDKVNKESDRTNIAEVLIEKHRNGPTGKAELYFDEKRATFQPIDKSGYSDFDAAF